MVAAASDYRQRSNTMATKVTKKTKKAAKATTPKASEEANGKPLSMMEAATRVLTSDPAARQFRHVRARPDAAWFRKTTVLRGRRFPNS
jgi:hypothetical protein